MLVPEGAAGDAGTLRVASWNVESVRAHLDQVTAWADLHQPDVLCLQETKAGARKFPLAPFEDRGYSVIVHGGEGGRGGLALASRHPVDDVVCGIPGAVAPLDEPRSISALIGGLRVHTVYAPNGRKVGTRPHQIKLAWFALLAAWLELDRAEHPAQLLIGDLNIAPLDIDVWDASRYRKRNLTSPPERRAFEALIGDGLLIDVVRESFGSEAVFTWWNRRADFYETDRGWRLDHVLASPDVADVVTSVWVDRAERGRAGSTDHAPVIVTTASTKQGQ